MFSVALLCKYTLTFERFTTTRRSTKPLSRKAERNSCQVTSREDASGDVKRYKIYVEMIVAIIIFILARISLLLLFLLLLFLLLFGPEDEVFLDSSLERGLSSFVGVGPRSCLPKKCLMSSGMSSAFWPALASRRPRSIDSWNSLSFFLSCSGPG